jgi:protein-tyrosine phosphatase
MSPQRSLAMKKLLFVCLGNICRSPTAEAIMKDMVVKRGLIDKFEIDSAGTIGTHAGELSDIRSRNYAQKKGIVLESISRKFNPQSDFAYFDLILPMDEKNLRDLRSMDEKKYFDHKIIPITDFCQDPNIKRVPDPYLEGEEGFELVFDILEDACSKLLNKLEIS